MDELIRNIDKIHTTKLGFNRIKNNLNINENSVVYCKKMILDEKSIITQKGKNYYCKNQNIVITINKKSFTVITAHIIKE